MPLVFKLVGYTADKKHYEIKDPFNGPINLKLLYELYKVWGLDEEEIENIKFITDSEQIKNPDKNFLVKDDEDRVIFVFTSVLTIRQKLHDIFIKEGTEVQIPSQTGSSDNVTEVQVTMVDPQICKPLTQIVIPDSIPQLTSELIDMMNIKSVSLFADQDFKNLISIYLRNPELFGIFAKYVQNGDVIEESLIPVKTWNMLSDEELINFNVLCTKVKNLGIQMPDEVIINRLIKYSGHLNLTVRSLLCETTH